MGKEPQMRCLVLVLLPIVLCGCGLAQPTMAGGKWAASLHDPDARVRRKAAFTLGNIGPSDPAVLPALIGALRDADRGVRCEAILALVKYGPGAREAIPALTEAREKDRDARVRSYAARALEKLETGAGPAP
jgi:HEAT repeat protein